MNSVKTGLWLACLCLMTDTLQAQPAQTALPALDGGKYCSGLSAMMGDNAVIKDTCLKQEADAKQNVQRVWKDTPEEIRKQCVALGNLNAQAATYQGLGGCLSLNVASEWLNGKLTLSKTQ